MTSGKKVIDHIYCIVDVCLSPLGENKKCPGAGVFGNIQIGELVLSFHPLEIGALDTEDAALKFIREKHLLIVACCPSLLLGYVRCAPGWC